MDYSQHDWGNPFIDMNSHGHEVSASIYTTNVFWVYDDGNQSSNHISPLRYCCNENGSLIVLRLVSSTLTMYIINLDINQPMNTVCCLASL